MLAIAGALSNHLIIRNEFTELELFAKANLFMVVLKQETNYNHLSTMYVRTYVTRFAKKGLVHAQFQDTVFITIC